MGRKHFGAASIDRRAGREPLPAVTVERAAPGVRVAIAVVSALVSGFAGVILAYHTGIPSGPAVTLFAGVLYIGSVLLGPVGDPAAHPVGRLDAAVREAAAVREHEDGGAGRTRVEPGGHAVRVQVDHHGQRQRRSALGLVGRLHRRADGLQLLDRLGREQLRGGAATEGSSAADPLAPTLAALVETQTPEALRRGVVTYSSGNHAQGVAYAARALGAKAVIVMPENTPTVKRDATVALGAEIVLVGPASIERKLKAGNFWASKKSGL